MIREQRITCDDGVTIAYQVQGKGTPLVLCSGLGGSAVGWENLTAYFQGSHRCLTWDYRGFHRSSGPVPKDSLTVKRHSMDLEALLEAEGMGRGVFVGWCMGAQVCLELYRRRPDLFSGLVIINGSYGHTLRTALGSGLWSVFLRTASVSLGAGTDMLKPVARVLTRMPLMLELTKLLGLVAGSLEERTFTRLARQFVELDFPVFWEALRGLDEHDASDVLPTIQTPTLIIVGDRDLLTPLALAREMKRRIAGAEMLVIPAATQYAPLEFPELINLRVRKFIEERVSEGASAPLSMAEVS